MEDLVNGQHLMRGASRSSPLVFSDAAFGIGTSGWNYPSGPRHLERDLLSERRDRGPRLRRARVSTPSGSTRSRSTPRSTASRGATSPQGGPSARRRASSSPSSCIRSSPTRKLAARPAPAISARPMSIAFKSGIEPLAAAGRLGPLLAQFPASFKDTPEARDYLDWLLETFRDYDVAVELRHRSWSDDAAEIFDLLHEHGAAWTQIDEPKFRFSIRQDLMPNVKTFYYMRLHGRNAGAVVGARTIRRSLQLSVFGGRAEAVCRGGEDGARAGQEAVRLPEQSLRGAGGRRCRGAAPLARRAGRGADARRARVALSDARRQSRYFASFTVALMMRSLDRDLLHHVHAASSPCRRSGTCHRVWLAGPMTMKLTVGLRRHRRHAPSRPCRSRACSTFENSATPIGVPLPPVPHCSFLVMSRVCGSPIWMTKFAHDAVNAQPVVEALSARARRCARRSSAPGSGRSRSRTCPSRFRTTRPGRCAGGPGRGCRLARRLRVPADAARARQQHHRQSHTIACTAS